MSNALTLHGGVSTVSHKVSDLQRDYTGVLAEVEQGHDVLLTKHGEHIAALVDIERYKETQGRAARAEELAMKLERVQALLDLALVGGPSLEEVRRQLSQAKGKTASEAVTELRRRRGSK